MKTAGFSRIFVIKCEYIIS